MLNVVAIMGRLVADPELRTTPQGTNVCSFRIACDRNFARQGEQRQADFIDIVAWRQQAEFVSKYFHLTCPILQEYHQPIYIIFCNSYPNPEQMYSCNLHNIF